MDNHKKRREQAQPTDIAERIVAFQRKNAKYVFFFTQPSPLIPHQRDETL